LVAVGHAGHPGVQRIADRLTSVPNTILHPTSDDSYRVRAGEWHEAWETFTGHPFLGVGLGHLFRYNGAEVHFSYKLDTPVVYLAKFGLLGFLALAVAAIALVRFTR